jgi:hypothetical protein
MESFPHPVKEKVKAAPMMAGTARRCFIGINLRKKFYLLSCNSCARHEPQFNQRGSALYKHDSALDISAW